MKIVRTPSTALLNRDVVLKALGNGADGVMIMDIEESHAAELSEKLAERLREELSELGVKPGRVMFKPMVLPIFKVLPKFIEDYVSEIEKLGKIPEEKHRVLLEA